MFMSDCPTPFLWTVIVRCRCLNGIYTTSSISKIHPSFGGAKSIDVPDVEKYSVHASAFAQVVVGRGDADKMFQKQTLADYMKAFLADLTEQV